MQWGVLKEQIRRLVTSLVTTASQLQPPNSGQAVTRQSLISVLAQFASSVLSSLTAAWIVQDWLRYSFSLVVIISFVLFFILSTIIQIRLPLRVSVFWILTILLAIVIVQGAVLAGLYEATRPPTVYLILDATEKTKSQYNDFRDSLKFAAQTMFPSSKSGLRVYGGNNVSGTTDCNNTRQLIKPTVAAGYKTELEAVLKTLEPGGHASLTVAVLDALRYDLKQHRGPIHLLIITSGIDSECEPRGEVFERIATDIKENSGSDINIGVVSIGNLSPNEAEVFKRYAHSFGGDYLPIRTPLNLPALIQAPRSYFSSYTHRLEPTATP